MERNGFIILEIDKLESSDRGIKSATVRTSIAWVILLGHVPVPDSISLVGYMYPFL